MNAVHKAPRAFQLLIAYAGPYDVVRLQQFEGRYKEGWKVYHGDSQLPEHLDWMVGLNMAPLLSFNEKEEAFYPPIMLGASADDDVVNPVHSLKMIAELQRRLPHNKNRVYSRRAAFVPDDLGCSHPELRRDIQEPSPH
jgi:prolyl oligopeptidase PreP (S9A serine peptidase family)